MSIKFNHKRVIAAFVSIPMIAFSPLYNKNIDISNAAISDIIINGNTINNSAISSRTYWKHDYSNSDLASYTEYNLDVSAIDNSQSIGVNTVFGSNGMVRDYDTSVVSLSTGGTGFIVGRHIIATAGHCVFNIDKDEFIDFKIDIVGEDNSVIKEISPQSVHVNKKFALIPSPRNYVANNDYALIYVSEDLRNYGMFKMGVALDSYVSNEGQVIVSGFPQRYPDNYSGLGWGIRFKASGNILSSKTHSSLLRYDADMSTGDSGGPVYVEEAVYADNRLTEYKTVIAINVAENDAYNTGVRINSDILKFYYGNKNI